MPSRDPTPPPVAPAPGNPPTPDMSRLTEADKDLLRRLGVYPASPELIAACERIAAEPPPAAAPAGPGDAGPDAELRRLADNKAMTMLAAWHARGRPTPSVVDGDGKPVGQAMDLARVYLKDRAERDSLLSRLADARGRLAAAEQERDDAVEALDKNWVTHQRVAAAESRLRLAREALLKDGYFKPDEVDDDVAPRIYERLSAIRAEWNESKASNARLAAEVGRLSEQRGEWVGLAARKRDEYERDRAGLVAKADAAFAAGAEAMRAEAVKYLDTAYESAAEKYRKEGAGYWEGRMDALDFAEQAVSSLPAPPGPAAGAKGDTRE